uniref:Uncharacterized protein n=1 Tax=Meloidogyne enterolobii TaxID=390850 RepID=A0A6V7X0U3_MELEN|nr:unnamed protein product [Meloidogyne enterolobii]
MLSLLSLLLASGTVLRADTERWTPLNYPNPRKNYTACNTKENSTLCDPDHILTDQWRAEINQNIQKQMDRLTEANVPLSEKAPVECINRTEGVLVYVLLAKRIWTPNNQSITGNDLTKFGDDLAKQYGLNDLPCQTFVFLIGIEAAKLAYVRTGKDLRLPADLMQRVFHEYKLFNAKNFMAGLNKIVDEIGRQMSDPFKEQTVITESRLRQNFSAAASSTEGTTLAELVAEILEKENNGTVDGETMNGIGETWNMNVNQMTAWLMLLSLCIAILLAFGSLALLAFSQQRRYEQMNKNNFQHQSSILAPTESSMHSWRCSCQKVIVMTSTENKDKDNQNEVNAQQMSITSEFAFQDSKLDEEQKHEENRRGNDENIDETSLDETSLIRGKIEDKIQYSPSMEDKDVNQRIHIGAFELLTDAPLSSNTHETEIREY